MLATRKKKEKSITGYTIFPTTDCNARCFYCFELGRSRIPMSSETALQAAHYIINHCGGQKVKLDFNKGDVYVDDQLLDEPYSDDVECFNTMLGDFCVPDESGIWEGKVPADHYFVLGDNRGVSKDSRAIGYISENQIVGEAVFRIAPLNKLGNLK